MQSEVGAIKHVEDVEMYPTKSLPPGHLLLISHLKSKGNSKSMYNSKTALVNAKR